MIINLAIFISFNLLALGTCSSFKEFKEEMENLVKNISQDMSRFYSEWSEGENSCKCDKKSFNACKGVKRKECNYQFPEASMCLEKGEYASSASSVKFPENVDYDNLTHEDIHFVCASARLEDTFQEIELIREKKFTYMYFGSNRGLFRRFPGEYRARYEVCDQYDPRMRPWYTIAASGAKNVLILIDKSSSMRKVSNHAKIVASTMIDTLSISDNMGIITFTNGTNVLGENKVTLIEATKTNKNILKDSISRIEFSFDEETNFANVFNKSLEIFNTTISQGESGCSEAENVLLLITDGNPTEGNLSSSYIIQMVKNFTSLSNSALKRMILFVYALGKINNTDYLRDLSCELNGMVLTSEENDELATTSGVATRLQSFYKYLSVGVTFTNPIWTEPYTDYYTGVHMITISMPAYYTNKTTNLTTVFGVAGLDINMNSFNRFGYSLSDIVVNLIGESACQKNLIDMCKLQFLRSPEYKCKYSNCTNDTNTTIPLICSHITTSQIYTTESSTKDTRRCCGLTNNEFAFIMGGSVVLALVIGFLIWKRKRLFEIFFGNRYRRIEINTSRNSNSENIEVGASTNTNIVRESSYCKQNKKQDRDWESSKTKEKSEDPKYEGYNPSESQSGIISNEI